MPKNVSPGIVILPRIEQGALSINIHCSVSEMRNTDPSGASIWSKPVLTKTGILLSIFLLIALFSIPPIYAYGGKDDNDSNDNAGQNKLIISSKSTDIEIGIEIEPNTLDENGEIEQASRVLYLISIFNGKDITIFDALLVAKVPQHTSFDFEASDTRWNSTMLSAADQNTSNRTCPDRYPPGLECSIELSNIEPDTRISTIRFAVDINGDIPNDVDAIDFSVELLGSMVDNGPLNIREATSANIALAAPTGLPAETEPQNNNYEDTKSEEMEFCVYLPWVAR